MNARNGYAATATRSRAAEGNLKSGAEAVASCAISGKSHAPAAAPAHCSRNCLRDVALMGASVTEATRSKIARGRGRSTLFKESSEKCQVVQPKPNAGLSNM